MHALACDAKFTSMHAFNATGILMHAFAFGQKIASIDAFHDYLPSNYTYLGMSLHSIHNLNLCMQCIMFYIVACMHAFE